MFVLSSRVHRNGAICREYYQPEEQGPHGAGVVFGLDGHKRAKQYLTEEEAVADIPAFKMILGFNDLSVEVTSA